MMSTDDALAADTLAALLLAQPPPSYGRSAASRPLRGPVSGWKVRYG